jgi:hypothetical protein
MIGKGIVLLLVVLFFFLFYAFYKDPLDLKHKTLKQVIYGGGGVVVAGLIVWFGFYLQGASSKYIERTSNYIEKKPNNENTSKW